ncbi:ABC transporter substrate-binding protein [Streptococcus entericus]|uniref:ABC transporter substrate-binding protein n=1 Tax=Streptococcus entericus TaxID=155680 RepID=UPI000378B100|nr:ABC transporter substrate-binding protein [Streptococcus entericus]
MKKLLTALVAFIGTLCLVACSSGQETAQSNLKKVDFILDWTPNTNHTGLYVAKELGYFDEVGINLDIKLPPEDSSSDLIINNKAPFGIYFQDSMANKLSKGAPITAVAAIIEHNTSGVISTEKAGVTQPKDMAGKKYGTWNDPIELAMIETLLTKQGADVKSVELVPNTDSNSITAMENGLFDMAWIFYAWDGVMAESQGMKTNFFYLKDYVAELDYYTPVIIANNDYLEKHPEEAKKVLSAIKKGYQYAMDNPEEAAKILIKHVPELQGQEDFIIASQAYLATQYATNKDKWGYISPDRWSAFYSWVNDNKLTETPLKADQGFSNDYLD